MISKLDQQCSSTGRGFSDEAIVAIKSPAEEDVVTYQRIKLEKRFRRKKAKGGIVQGRVIALGIRGRRVRMIEDYLCE